jgi:hypothetical protein
MSVTEGVIVTITAEIAARMLRRRGIDNCVACDVVFGAVREGEVEWGTITPEQYGLLVLTALALQSERGECSHWVCGKEVAA